MKINSFAHGAKVRQNALQYDDYEYPLNKQSNDTAITLSHDEEWILDPKKTLLESKISQCQYVIWYYNYNWILENETELSYYNTIDYEKYKQNPRLLW